MDFITLLNQIIIEELNRIEQNGEKVKLKSIRRQRIISAMILVVSALVMFIAPLMSTLCVVCIGIVIFKNVKINKVKTIAKLAQKMPDTPIDEIIRGDMI